MGFSDIYRQLGITKFIIKTILQAYLGKTIVKSGGNEKQLFENSNYNK